MRTLVLVSALTAWIIPATQANAAFPGANGRIAFSTDLGGRPQVFTALPDGSDLRQLTHVAKGHAASSPDWSSDGSRIVFTLDNEIWVMNPDGSNQMQLTQDPDRVNQAPSWSPDGTRIVFSRCSSPFGADRCSIDVMNADGTGRTKLLGGDWRSQNPEYSPDGRLIAFASNRGGYVSNVWVMGADGSNPKRLTPAVLQAWAPDWSPDGTHIVFTDQAELPHSNVWIMEPDGSELTQITDFHPGDQGGVASYSPDGRKFVLIDDLAHRTPCCFDLAVMNIDGSHLHSIVTTQPRVFSSDWGPA
jgi:Tol biopolymer transport system component